MQKWESISNADNEVDVALKKVYHNIDAKIDGAIPELKDLNMRISNLISAEQAIKHRINVEANSPIIPENIFSLASIPLRPLKSTGFKTGIAKLISQQYKK
jgi:hypothetical protein